MDYQINLDGPKLFGSWEGFSINIHARTRFGEDINAEAGEMVLPNTGMLMALTGNYHDTDITGLVASQFLPFNGGLANITLGKLDVIDTVTMFFPNVTDGSSSPRQRQDFCCSIRRSRRVLRSRGSSRRLMMPTPRFSLLPV